MRDSTPDWFMVDRHGLAKIKEGMPKSALVYELLGNCFDEDAKHIKVMLQRNDPTRHYLVVQDDAPAGYSNLAHSFTLFADSAKRADLSKRGRFNLGVKLVLSLCDSASIKTTKGSVLFDGTGRRTNPDKTSKGSVFTGTIRMTREEALRVIKDVDMILVPKGVKLTVNDKEIAYRPPVRTVTAELPTVVSGDDGILRPSSASTTIEVVPLIEGEKAFVYEMGIPVVPFGDSFHYNVGQKVPLTMDRANVTPEFLRIVRSVVAEACVDLIGPEIASAKWVKEAVSQPEASRELVDSAFRAKFGKNAVIFDPSDPEANRIAEENGVPVVTGRMLTKDEWANVKKHAVAEPAGKVFPSAKPPVETVQPEDWTAGMQNVAKLTAGIGQRLFDNTIKVEFVCEERTKREASYDVATGVFRYNMSLLDRPWFACPLSAVLLEIILAAFGREKNGAGLGARTIMFALEEPEFFRQFTGSVEVATSR